MIRPLAMALVLACVIAPAASAQADLKDLRTRARKASAAQAPDLWLELAEASRKRPMFHEALSHLDPIRLAALSATLKDPDISAAMVRALRARGRSDEAAGECGAAHALRSARLVEACKDCCSGQLPFPAGPASHSVFRQWIVLPSGGTAASAYAGGMRRGLGTTPWMARMKITPLAERDDPRLDGMAARQEPFGVVVGDPADPRGARAAALAAAFGLTYVALGPSVTLGDSTRSAQGPGERALVPRPGPDAQARGLLEAARQHGIRKLALILPSEGGDVRLARALERAAHTGALAVTTIEYLAGRREHREDVRRVRASGADAVVLLGPAEESADWLPALRAGGGALLVLGTDELDPAGFHEPARRAVEGAIFVRTRYAPADTSEVEWDGLTAAAWIAGWAVGNAIAQGADSPRALVQALESRIVEGDASDAWLAVPPEVARIEVLRVKNGRAEILR